MDLHEYGLDTDDKQTGREKCNSLGPLRMGRGCKDSGCKSCGNIWHLL